MATYQSNCISLTIGLSVILGDWTASTRAADKPFVHPGILHSRAELDLVKAKVAEGEEPWKSAWAELRNHAISNLDWKVKPAANVVRGPYNNPDIGGTDLMRDAAAAYSHAIQWYITSKNPHAQKTIEILNAYATKLKTVGGHDAKLLVGMVGINFVNAAEIIRHSHTGWNKDDQQQFRQLLTHGFYPVIQDFYPTANGNWDAAMIQTMLAMGVFLDDRAMFDRAADYYLKGEGNGAIRKYINDFGECQESGRDQAHTQMGLGYLGCAAEIAWKQGVDLYGADDNRLALGFEYTAKYNLGHDVRYEPYRSHQGRYNYTSISDKARGRFSSIYERVYHHYHDRMGLEMTFIGQVVEKNRPERWQSAYASWGTLMCAQGPVAQPDRSAAPGSEEESLQVGKKLADRFECAHANLSDEPGDDSKQRANDILRETGVKGGLVVHLGCGDGKLTAALRASDSYRVHGLDTNEENVKAARTHIRSLGLSGKASVDRLMGDHLPYVDNLVNLIVASDCPVAGEEIARVLAPGGVALFPDRRSAIEDRKWVKPRPDEIDEWTHWLHDASGNAVARDKVVGPPRHYRWLAGPRWSSHHDTVLSTSAVVSAGGKIFCIVNEAPVSEFHDRSSGHWFLLARDAFSGVLLWKIPMTQWGWQAWGESFVKRFAQPVQLPSRLVTDGDRVYVTLGFHAPVSVVDAETGTVVKTLESTRSADEILLHDRKLIASVYDPKNRGAEKTIRSIDIQTGDVIWESGPYVGLPACYDAVEGWDPIYLTAYQNRIVFVSKGSLVCLETDSGKARWKVPRPAYREHRMHLGVRQSENCTLVNHQEIVLYAQPAGRLPHTNHTVECDLYAFSADTGEVLWKGTCGTWAWGHQADVFVIDDLVWVHEHIPTEMKGPAPVHLDTLNHALLGLNVRTGEIERKIPTTDIFRIGHHHRCYRNKATTRYVFTARRGTETTDLESGDIRLHPWVRSECRFGIMPANGLLYTFPHPCACYAGVTLTGFNALAAAKKKRAESRERKAGDRLERGAAYGPIGNRQSAIANPHDWSTYRGNAARNGFTSQQVPTDLQPAWQTKLGGRLSSVVVAEGRLLVASIDMHTVHALDADSGDALWSFMAGGRVDSPPTICTPEGGTANSLCLFGSADGYVYCLRTTDGALAWRFRAAPEDRRMVVDDQPESVWPVHGSVLVRRGEVIAVAGRSSYLDGGLYAYRLHLETGRMIEQKRISHERLTDRKTLASEAGKYDHYYTDGTLTDILAARGDSVYLKARPIFGAGRRNDPVLATHSGFLDDSLFERSFWYVAAPGRQPIGAQLIVHDRQTVFGFRAYPSASRGGPWHVLGSGYSLFAAPCPAAERSSDDPPENQPYVPDFLSKPFRSFTWKQTVPVRARAMVLTQDVLLLAGSPDVVEPETDPYAAVEGKLGGKLLVISREDGKTLAQYALEAPPVWDGMAAARGNVYFALRNGTLARMTAK